MKMTQEYPLKRKDDYQHRPSVEQGLLEEFDENHDPEYLLEGETMESRQIDLGEFLYQKELSDYLT